MEAADESGLASTADFYRDHGDREHSGRLRFGGSRFRDESHQRTRINDDIAEQGTRRLGTLAILTAVSVVGMAFSQQALQPELAAAHATPLFRVAALSFVLASLGLAALQRFGLVCSQTLLDVGLGFEIAGAAAIGIIENSAAWPDDTVRGSTAVAAWIALCTLLIPNRPWKNFIAAALSAVMAPAAHLLAAQVLSYPPLPWNRLASYALTPLLIAGWTPFISTRIHEMQKELSRAKDLGSYHLETLIGKGGMGEVWRARHRLLRREAAVKLVRPDLLSRAGAAERRTIRQRFEREAQAIASLRSPDTIALYDFGMSEDESLYYAMELLDGLDVESLVKGFGPQPPGRVLSLIRQACASLEEAHDSGMIHRDIKPTNLFICRLGKEVDFVKMLDFGLVKTLLDPGQSRLTMERVTSGTPAFMAPEQVRAEPDIDGRTDIYGLGCVAYFLLTGSLVFDELDPFSAAIAHVERVPEPPSKRSELPIPESLDRLVIACLEKKRENRPQSASDLISAIDSLSDIPRWTPAEAKAWWALHRPAAAKEPV